MRFILTGGQAPDGPQAVPLLTGIETGAVLADKGYESNRILAFIRSCGATAVIPPKANRKETWEYDRELYRQRNLIERAFNKLKHWRRIAARYDRRKGPSLRSPTSKSSQRLPSASCITAVRIRQSSRFFPRLAPQ